MLWYSNYSLDYGDGLNNNQPTIQPTNHPTNQLTAFAPVLRPWRRRWRGSRKRERDEGRRERERENEVSIDSLMLCWLLRDSITTGPSSSLVPPDVRGNQRQQQQQQRYRRWHGTAMSTEGEMMRKTPLDSRLIMMTMVMRKTMTTTKRTLPSISLLFDHYAVQ